MADSVGAGFPTRNIQRGHLFFDTDTSTLYVYIGGDPAGDAANWRSVSVGSVIPGSETVAGFVRWPWMFTGTSMSTGFGEIARATFVAPAAGRITQWQIVESFATWPTDATILLNFDPFGASINVDIFTLPSGTQNEVFTRNVSRIVAAGDIVMVQQNTTLSPALHNVVLSGYVDFTPD